jgi:hypothetical protein
VDSDSDSDDDGPIVISLPTGFFPPEEAPVEDLLPFEHDGQECIRTAAEADGTFFLFTQPAASSGKPVGSYLGRFTPSTGVLDATAENPFEEA